MANNFQDDGREDRMRALFNLYRGSSEGRSGVDAYLEFDDNEIPFELKTTSKGSVTTVRDFGPHHIEKWKAQHWIFGFFLDGREFYKYGSPTMMEPWITEKAMYVAPDFALANLAPKYLQLKDMHEILGAKAIYTYEDAKYIQKRQLSKKDYLALQDVKGGYSPARMLEIIQQRASYLMKRGSTLNNPHIPFKYFDGWQEITKNHASELRRMVKEYYSSLKSLD